MKQSILLVHVGPVQDFISSARRCRDLWCGSKLLSETSRRVAQALVEASGGEQNEVLVFPGRINPRSGEDISVANKIQLTIQAKSHQEAAEVAQAGREELTEFITGLAREQFDIIKRRLRHYDIAEDDDFKVERAMDHVRGMMEYFWVAVPIQEAGYGAARSRAEALLAARKNTRNWSSATFDEYGVPKSALDGVRESVIDESVYDNHRKEGEYTDWMRYDIFGIRSSERLCGVGLLKRRGQLRDEHNSKAPPFHSTSHIASAPTRCRLDTYKLGEEWNAFLDLAREFLGLDDFRTRHPLDTKKHLNPFVTYTASDPRQNHTSPLTFRHALPNQGESPLWGYDGVLLYPNRVSARGESSLLNQFDQSDSGLARGEISERLIEAQRDLLQKANVPGLTPFAYYALLQADGDRMGRAIDALGDQALHQRFSLALDQQFASQCGAIVAEHGGSLIYSGGDDVLALLPLHTALQCSEALRKQFCDAMKDAFSGLSDTIQQPTLSVGIAIAHHMEPFGDVRQQARQAESLAKDRGRNRLAIILRKRGNAPQSVVGPWNNPTGFNALFERLRRWARVCSHRELPSGLAYKLEECVAAFSVDSTDDNQDISSEDFTALCRSLVQGVVARRELQNQSLAEDLVQHQSLAEDLVQLFDKTLQERAEATTQHAPIRAVQQMAQELRIASMFADAWDMAFATPNEGDTA